MGDRSRADGLDRSARASFTSRKFNLIDALIEHPRISSSEFRALIAIVQRVDQNSGTARVGDETLTKVLRCERSALTRLRKRIRGLGLARVKVGRYGRVTEYTFLALLADNASSVRHSEVEDNAAPVQHCERRLSVGATTALQDVTDVKVMLPTVLHSERHSAATVPHLSPISSNEGSNNGELSRRASESCFWNHDGGEAVRSSPQGTGATTENRSRPLADAIPAAGSYSAARAWLRSTYGIEARGGAEGLKWGITLGQTGIPPEQRAAFDDWVATMASGWTKPR